MYDPILLEVFKNRFASIAEEMGVVLRRTSYSPNIKERLDFSCAVFDAQGRMIAQAAHIPVHLGAMPVSVSMAIEQMTFAPGDVIILNDPFHGGSHLPDITMITPVFIQAEEQGSGGASEQKNSPLPVVYSLCSIAAFWICSQPSPPCRRGRDDSRLDAPGAGDLSGRTHHSASETGRGRADE